MLTEWLDMTRQARAHVPSNPFEIEAARQQRRLIVSSSLDELSGPITRPSIVLAAHPSLRMGDAPRLLEFWKADPRALLLLTHPRERGDAETHLLLAPFAPLRMQVLSCAIDARFDVTDAACLVKELSPKRLIVPAIGADAEPTDPTSTPLGGACPLVHPLSLYEALELPTTPPHEVAFMPMRAAAEVKMAEAPNGMNIGRFSGYMRRCPLHGELRLLPDAWVEPGHTPSDEEQAEIAARVESNRAFHAEENAVYFGGLLDAQAVVEELGSRGVAARVKAGATEALTVVELLSEPYAAGHTCIELRYAESTVVADYGAADALPDDLEQWLAVLQEVLEMQLVRV